MKINAFLFVIIYNWNNKTDFSSTGVLQMTLDVVDKVFFNRDLLLIIITFLASSMQDLDGLRLTSVATRDAVRSFIIDNRDYYLNVIESRIEKVNFLRINYSRDDRFWKEFLYTYRINKVPSYLDFMTQLNNFIAKCLNGETSKNLTDDALVFMMNNFSKYSDIVTGNPTNRFRIKGLPIKRLINRCKHLWNLCNNSTQTTENQDPTYEDLAFQQLIPAFHKFCFDNFRSLKLNIFLRKLSYISSDEKMTKTVFHKEISNLLWSSMVKPVLFSDSLSFTCEKLEAMGSGNSLYQKYNLIRVAIFALYCEVLNLWPLFFFNALELDITSFRHLNFPLFTGLFFFAFEFSLVAYAFVDDLVYLALRKKIDDRRY